MIAKQAEAVADNDKTTEFDIKNIPYFPTGAVEIYLKQDCDGKDVIGAQFIIVTTELNDVQTLTWLDVESKSKCNIVLLFLVFRQRNTKIGFECRWEPASPWMYTNCHVLSLLVAGKSSLCDLLLMRFGAEQCVINARIKCLQFVEQDDSMAIDDILNGEDLDENTPQEKM